MRERRKKKNFFTIKILAKNFYENLIISEILDKRMLSFHGKFTMFICKM